ncbi:MAG: radical SAM protein [Ruminococcaceae bacterium]|nr:radical SAM protein [Oscillospiraceae bacterium]
MRKYNLPVFIPHRGCPHDCVFCNQRKITGVDTEITPEYVRILINDFFSTINTENSDVEIAFFGGSFTGLEFDTQEGFLSVAAEFADRISGIRLSTRPDYIDADIIRLLKKYNVTTVELGVQSSNDKVLAKNSRGHSFENVKKASEMIREAGISLGHQMMLGMYGSTPDTDMQTVRDIIDLSPSCVRIYPVVTLRDTALEKLYNDGVYEPYSVELAAELSKKALIAFRENNIEVIRIGLHSSDELETDGNVVAGPYHQAFGEIVESLIYRDMIEKEISGKEESSGELLYFCKKGDVSKAVGHKGMNKIYFREKYGVNLKIRER